MRDIAVPWPSGGKHAAPAIAITRLEQVAPRAGQHVAGGMAVADLDDVHWARARGPLARRVETRENGLERREIACFAPATVGDGHAGRQGEGNGEGNRETLHCATSGAEAGAVSIARVAST